MEYNRIVAITGLTGLFEVLSSKNDGALVRSLADNTTKFVSSRVHNMSHLESIEVYTVRENVNLAEIFSAMKGSSEALPDIKDTAALKAYFQKVYPDLDFERVYASDLKKMVKWFEVLRNSNIEIKAVNAQEEAEEATETENVVEPVSITPEATKEEKPKAARAPRKKKSEEGESEA